VIRSSDANIIILLAVPSLSQPNITVVNHDSWAEVLENWIILQSNNSRVARIMKIHDKAVTVSKVATPNKREVSETDLFLLGMFLKNSKQT